MSQRYLLDSNFCIACLRRKPWALKALANVPLASVAISSMTYGELILGSRLAASPAVETSKVRAFLAPIAVLPFGRSEAERWAEIDGALRLQGNRIETEDAIIAATAIANDLVLVTGNARHFGRIEGLNSVDWETHFPAG